MTARLIEVSHVFCPTCSAMQPAGLHSQDDDGNERFIGVDLVCSVCGTIVATIFKERRP